MIDIDEYKEALEALKSGFLDTADIEPYMQIICNALEKQIPKKPRKEKYFYGKIYYCPLCKKSIGKEAFVLTSSCQSCGQTLDWSDENK